MFKALEHLNNDTALVVEEEDLFETAFDHFELDMTDFNAAESLAETIKNLNALKGAVEQFGFSKSLLSFANHDGNLCLAIPAVPSLEAFMADESIDPAASVESIVEKIKETTGRWWTAIKNHITKFKKWYVAALVVSGAAATAVYGMKVHKDYKLSGETVKAADTEKLNAVIKSKNSFGGKLRKISEGDTATSAKTKIDESVRATQEWMSSQRGKIEGLFKKAEDAKTPEEQAAIRDEIAETQKEAKEAVWVIRAYHSIAKKICGKKEEADTAAA